MNSSERVTKQLASSFQGELRKKILDLILKQIICFEKQSQDFESEVLIDSILKKADLPYDRNEIMKSNLSNKSRILSRLPKKRKFIKIFGKILCEILDYSRESNQIDLQNKYGLGARTIIKLIKYLHQNYNFDPNERFKYSKIDVRRKSYNDGYKDWSFLDYNKSGQRISRTDTLDKLSNYVKKNFTLDENYAPCSSDILEEDPHFHYAFINRGFTLEEITENAGLSKKIDHWIVIEETENSSVYTTLELIQDIKYEIANLENKYVSHRLMSKILGQPNSHIKSIIEYCRNDKYYLLTKEIINTHRKNLRIRYNDIRLIEFLYDRYLDLNELYKSRYQVIHYHPNLDLDYFRDINTKEKAYWFGLLFADGSVFKLLSGGKNPNLVISLELNIKDAFLIKGYIKSIGFNPKYVEYRKRKIKNKTNNEIRTLRTFRVRFANLKFAKNMINNGFIIGKKSHKIRFPTLSSRELELAFLLGFFDGDGKQGTTRINSASFYFLNDIKKKFNIRNNIGSEKRLTKEEIIKKYFSLHLGAEFFREILDNYKYSLPRKRIRYFGNY